MKINLVNYEMSLANGILSKFAWKMSEELDKIGIKNVVTDAPDPKYDVNHHIIYVSYRHVDSINTVMVTHINTAKKQEILSKVMETADLGICMSQQMIDEQIALGLPKDKLTYVVPAHDSDVLPLPVAILTNVYDDGVKREGMLNELAKVINPARFIFRIMGRGWNVDALKAAGLHVEYYPDFNREIQNNYLLNSKYYLYFGLDQGSMALLDAARAGLKTIAPLDGYHNHAGVDYPFTTQQELNAVFLNFQKMPLEDWTWGNYTKKHIEVWEELVKRRK